MKKTYYEILEISENASDEIINKAYKVLSKKYHPDLQNDINKKECEEMLVKINEAYEVLSDKIKKEDYDGKLKYKKENTNNDYTNKDIVKANDEIERQIKQKVKEAEMRINAEENKILHEIYEEYKYNFNNQFVQKNPTIKEQLSYFKMYLKRILKSLLIYLIIFIIGLIIYKIPFINNYIVILEEKYVVLKIISNIFRYIIDVILRIIINIFRFRF